MSYHEDRFIEWLGEQDGKLGASPGMAIDRLRRQNGALRMIANDQPLRKQMIKQILDILMHHNPEQGYELTDWESKFIGSVNEQFEHKGDLSNKQCEILERIYDKV